MWLSLAELRDLGAVESRVASQNINDISTHLEAAEIRVSSSCSDGKHDLDPLISFWLELSTDIFCFVFADIEGLSQQLMAKLAMPTIEGSSIFIDDPTSKRSALGPRQIEVRCVFLEDILGKICCLLFACHITNTFAQVID